VKDQKVFKFKKLVEVCLETKNYIKLSAATLILLRNTVISHAYSLQISLRSDAHIYEIMLQIDRVLSLKSIPSIYDESMITRIKLIENLMKKGKGNIPLRFIKDAASLYFDLQQVSIPTGKLMVDPSSTLSSKGFFSRFNKSEIETPILQLITHELSSREESLRSRANNGKNESAMMELKRISRLKASLTNNTSKRVRVNGPISKDQRYLLFITQSKAYPLYGMFFLLVTLSLLVLVQMTLNFALLAPLGTFFLMFAGGAGFSLYLYSLAKRKVVSSLW
jgi:hypothetical protein